MLSLSFYAAEDGNERITQLQTEAIQSKNIGIAIAPSSSEDQLDSSTVLPIPDPTKIIGKQLHAALVSTKAIEKFSLKPEVENTLRN